jgi:COMPASS component SWD2
MPCNKHISCGCSYLQDNTQQINSLDFHRTADLLVTASHDDLLYVYDTAQGQRLLTEVPSKKYGAQNVVWTHSTEQILFASNKVRSQ